MINKCQGRWVDWSGTKEEGKEKGKEKKLNLQWNRKDTIKFHHSFVAHSPLNFLQIAMSMSMLYKHISPYSLGKLTRITNPPLSKLL